MKPESFYQGKNVLVTGGAGFIGSHLVERLIELGARVTVFDNFCSGNLNHLSSVITQVNLFYADITTPYSCLKATVNKDIVFHLAAFVSVARSITNPEICSKINIEGTKNILEGCKTNRVPTLIFSSSAAVYGAKNDICDEQDTLNPLSPYAQSKAEGELLCKKYAEEGAVSTASLRYFNVYGDRQDPNGEYAAAVAKFKHNILNKKPIAIYGDGKQTRDFIHVSKAVEANLNIGMMNSLKGEAINIGSGKSINLLELIKQLETELNIKSTEVTFHPARKGDIMHSQANCQKYNKLLLDNLS